MVGDGEKKSGSLQRTVLSQDLRQKVAKKGETVDYCVDCNYFSTRIKGRNKQGFDGYCLKAKKNIYQTNRAYNDFIRDAL